jgi:hypothetical protein
MVLVQANKLGIETVSTSSVVHLQNDVNCNLCPRGGRSRCLEQLMNQRTSSSNSIIPNAPNTSSLCHCTFSALILITAGGSEFSVNNKKLVNTLRIPAF